MNEWIRRTPRVAGMRRRRKQIEAELVAQWNQVTAEATTVQQVRWLPSRSAGVTFTPFRDRLSRITAASDPTVATTPAQPAP